MEELNSKRKVLRDKVVDLVVMFVRSEGCITSLDLHRLFGHPVLGHEVAIALAQKPVIWTSS